MKKILICLLFLPLFSYSQDLYVQYFDVDQRAESIKAVWITDENGTVKEKNYPAKSQIHLIKIFEQKKFKVKDIKVAERTAGGMSMTKYHIWFDKIEENKE